MGPKKSPLSEKQRMMQAKKAVLKIVENMLEESISKEWFLENCVKLCQADYDDVIQERSIEHMCGYPMCSKQIQKVIKQQYRISANKIYDITERKNFCSDECYKASNFLKAQLHSLPLYMRKADETLLILKLLSDSENRGSTGEELVFHRSISKDEIEEKNVPVSASVNLNNILQQDIKECTEHLADLEIKENVYREKYVFGEEAEKSPDEDVATLQYEDSQNSDSEDINLFQDYDNPSVLSNKHMPVSGKTKKTVLIAPLKAATIKNGPSKPAKLNTNFLSKVFQDWFTEDTMKYLLGEKQVYSIKAENLFKTMVMTNQSPEELTSMKEEYVHLCMKIDKLPDEEENLSDLSDTPEITVSKSPPGKSSLTTQDKLEQLSLEADLKSIPAQKIPKRKTKRNTGKNKSVSFAPGSKSEKNKSENNERFEDTESKNVLNATLPLVDSLSQNTLRKQVLISKLKSVYLKILPIIDLHYRDIKEEVLRIIDTFSLSPANIVFKPRHQECIGLVLYRILTKTKILELNDESQFTKLCENYEIISQEAVETLVCDLTSSDQVLRLQKS